MSSSLCNQDERAERRRLQNREAQRNHRKSLKQKVLAYEKLMEVFESVRTSQNLEYRNESKHGSPLLLHDNSTTNISLLPLDQPVDQAATSGISITVPSASDPDDYSSSSGSEMHEFQVLSDAYLGGPIQQPFKMSLEPIEPEQASERAEGRLNAYQFASTLNQDVPSSSSMRGICSPLHDAIRKGDVEILALLLDHGADATMRDSTGSTPLHLASQLGNEEIVRCLLKQYDYTLTAAANASGLTPLRLAIQNGHAHVVKILLETGMDANGSANA